MATIKTRKKANGATRYTAIVRLRKGKVILHKEAKTFTHRSAAISWARFREVALEDPEELRKAQEHAQERTQESHTLAAVIGWYIETFESISNWQRTKQCQLKALANHLIGGVAAISAMAPSIHGGCPYTPAPGARRMASIR